MRTPSKRTSRKIDAGMPSTSTPATLTSSTSGPRELRDITTRRWSAKDGIGNPKCTITLTQQEKEVCGLQGIRCFMIQCGAVFCGAHGDTILLGHCLPQRTERLKGSSTGPGVQLQPKRVSDVCHLTRNHTVPYLRIEWSRPGLTVWYGMVWHGINDRKWHAGSIEQHLCHQYIAWAVDPKAAQIIQGGALQVAYHQLTSVLGCTPWHVIRGAHC